MSDFSGNGRLLTSSAPPNLPDSDFTSQLTGRRLTTTEILYYMPANPSLLQSFLWQTLDSAPDFPRIHRFLDFWRREIDAVIHSVSIAGVQLIRPNRVRSPSFYGQINPKEYN